jgi:hypothetical protein
MNFTTAALTPALSPVGRGRNVLPPLPRAGEGWGEGEAGRRISFQETHP